MNNKLTTWKDKILFTPGPLTTSPTVKQAMLRDLGSRDFDFIEIIKSIRKRLLKLGKVDNKNYETILMQGSGTFSIEAVISSTIPPEGKILIIINGAYGKRMASIADIQKIDSILLQFPENTTPNIETIEKCLKENPDITHVAVVHCETTTGIINPIKEIGLLSKKYNKKYFVDSMSIFGAIDMDIEESKIDYLVSSANKCVEGSPGFAFVIAKKDSLLETEGYSRSLSFDLYSQWKGLESNGQFRFTPPTHSLLAFDQALNELFEEGGVTARSERYKSNRNLTIKGMRKLGFKEYLKEEDQSYIITSFHYPKHENFDFNVFYEKLNQKNYVIYPGKVSDAECFRIGHIGRITTCDVRDLLSAIKDTLEEMNINL